MSLAHVVRILAAVLVSFGMALPIEAAEPTEAQAADLKKLQGTWHVTAVTDERERLAVEAGEISIEVKGSRLRMRSLGDDDANYEVALDPTKMPARIDLKGAGETKDDAQGIYAFTDKGWKLCIGTAEKRPTNFDTKDKAEFLLFEMVPAPAESIAAAGEAGDGKPWRVVKLETAAIAVPKGWRELPKVFPGAMLGLNGDGVGVLAADENGEPLQIGLTVEKHPGTKGSIDEGIEMLTKSAKRNPRLEMVGAETVEKLKLADGSDASLLTIEFIKDDDRRSLQMKLLVKDAASNGWIVGGQLVGGKESKLPQRKSDLAQWLRGYLLSFSLDGSKIDPSKLKAFTAEK